MERAGGIEHIPSHCLLKDTTEGEGLFKVREGWAPFGSASGFQNSKALATTK